MTIEHGLIIKIANEKRERACDLSFSLLRRHLALLPHQPGDCVLEAVWHYPSIVASSLADSRHRRDDIFAEGLVQYLITPFNADNRQREWIVRCQDAEEACRQSRRRRSYTEH